jgi:hypothetical protein
MWVLWRKLAILAKAERPRAVFITGWPFYQMLLSTRIKRQLNLPVVLDFQDPWFSSHGATLPFWSKQGLTNRLASVLEPRALRGASFITSVSEVQNAEMAGRYPWLGVSRMAAIPIGGDPEDFDVLRSTDVLLPEGMLDPVRINLSFVGAIMPRSGTLLRLVLEAFNRFRREEPALGKRVRMNFIGTSNQPSDNSTFRVIPIARSAGVADAVHEVPQRIPFLQALTILSRSQGILLIGSDEPHYTASKIYPALMSGRPFLSLFHCASSSHSILSSAGGGLVHTYNQDGDDEELLSKLAASLRKIVVTPNQIGRANPCAYAPFEARSVTSRFAAIFNEVSTGN